MFPYCLILTIMCVGAQLAASFSIASMGRPLQPGERALSKKEMRKHVLWGLVYSNPDDPRGWVPRTRGLGWSVNVRTESAARGYAIISLVMIASVTATIVSLAFTIAPPR
jgi:uncharacterized membrane protein